MKSKFFSIIVASLAIISCSKDEVKVDPLVIPSTYEASTFATNTAPEVLLRADYVAFENELKKARTKGTVVDAATLNASFAKSIAGLSTAYYKTLVPALNEKIAKASKANAVYQLGKTPAENGIGGVAGAYIFDEKGLDLEQVISKGLFGAFHYNQGVALLGNPTQANLDKAIYYFGANPLFPNTNNPNKSTTPDVYLANYVARRTKGSGGIYLDVKAGFIKAQAAVRAGSSYNKDRDEAIEAILLGWEKGNAATVINYLNDVYVKFSITPATDVNRIGGLHSLGESIGFLGGLKGISKKKITDAQIDELLAKMENPSKFVGNQAEVEKILELSKTLQNIYGFTVQDMLDFKGNWVTLEER